MFSSQTSTEEGIWSDHVAPFEAFLAVQSQWNMVISPMGERVLTGLNYGSVEAGLRLAEISLSPTEFADFRTIEKGVIEALEEARQ